MRRPLKIFLGLCLAIVMAGALTFCISESLVLRASRGQNYEDADYIIVLGAKVDPWGPSRALDDRLRAALSYLESYPDAKAVVTGGQGADEPIAEAEAMRRYLVEQGIPEEKIVLEDRSRNTFQNMAFSKALIEREARGARVVYATTNYHVFRSGVWANLAGLPAEGVGSQTKWWYWPNAFMRECVGLMMNRIPQELLLLAVMIAFFGALSVALG